MATLIYDEARLFGICFLLGGALAFFYDCIRIVRLLIRHKDWIVDLEDLGFWLVTAWLVFCTLFTYNRGALRGYAFFGMFLGVVIYALTLSRMILFVVGKMIPYWKRGLEIFQKPFRFFEQNVKKILKNFVTDVKIAFRSR